MSRFFRPKKKGTQPKEDSGIAGLQHTANDTSESNKKDTIADIQLRVNPETRTVPRLGVGELFEPTAAVVE